MAKEFPQVAWDDQLEAEFRALVRLAEHEDLNHAGDWTSLALVGETVAGSALIVARGSGVVAGLPAARILAAEIDADVEWSPEASDGDAIAPGQVLARLQGKARSLLVAERPLLNVLGHLSGIATLTRRYVDAVAATKARIYDTRKTLPGWRRLEKYAVRMGGGHNHRTGLGAAILIKDNHLALGAAAGQEGFSPAEAVRRARAAVELLPGAGGESMIVEIEIDRLEDLEAVLAAGPDIVLLDNMPPERLRQAVACRDARAPQVELEASGGVTLATVAGIAATGVERISVGAVTHSAPWFDVALDWQAGPQQPV